MNMDQILVARSFSTNAFGCAKYAKSGATSLLPNHERGNQSATNYNPRVVCAMFVFVQPVFEKEEVFRLSICPYMPLSIGWSDFFYCDLSAGHLGGSWKVVFAFWVWENEILNTLLDHAGLLTSVKVKYSILIWKVRLGYAEPFNSKYILGLLLNNIQQDQRNR